VNYDLDTLEAHCVRLAELRDEAGTADRPFRIVASPLAVPNPDVIDRLASLGVTTLLTSAWMAVGVSVPDSVEHATELLGAYAERFIRPLGRADS
jgi:hypothetical protein